MSGDPEQEYFADGMVEEITTALSRFKGLFVIAPIRVSPSRAKRSTSRKSGGGLACAMSSSGRCARRRGKFASPAGPAG
jgi:adenylate cyclase